MLSKLFAKLVGSPATRPTDFREHVREIERLAKARPGGSPDNPIDVPTPSVIEIRAEARPCPQCAGRLRLVAPHVAPAPGLRRADVRCEVCSTKRSFWFRLTPAGN